ncbi:hypothetical protein PVK06_008794 [Gossypium arboreum]|uniref:AIG1-type G domain-containing protein n=1 Tax=Gossypium arboreum TaxID=29729 RepID=A0ABR0QKU5_GOSAR|nr:hypothetical protein PVK06_008794 [Gossypium arboreum]
MGGGSAVYDDCEFTSPSNGAKTLILVGRTGNGKSPSSLGIKSFTSKISPSGGSLNGDALEEDVTLKDYLDDGPQPLKEVLLFCGHRFVLFDNKTEDKTKRVKQVDDLVSLVNMVIAQNSGQPYYDELFVELKDRATTCDKQEEVASLKGYIKQEICKEQNERLYEKLLMRISELVETKLKRLEEKLAKEQAARKLDQMKSDEINKLREYLENAQRETVELCKKAKNKCAIL